MKMPEDDMKTYTIEEYFGSVVEREPRTPEMQAKLDSMTVPPWAGVPKKGTLEGDAELAELARIREEIRAEERAKAEAKNHGSGTRT